ncbi:MAG: lysostaphin resistance A-like protein, partial [Actinomycetota bacterium]
VLVPLGALGARPSTAFLFVIGGLLVFASFLASTWFFTIKRKGATLSSAGLSLPRSPKIFLLMVPVTIGAMLVNWFLTALMGLVFGDVPTGEDQLVPPGTDIDLGVFLALFVLAAITAPIVEEFFFRGILFRWLRSGKGFLFAATVSSLVFAVAHGIPPLIVPLFGFGFVLTLIVEHTKSIYPAMLVHGLNNGAVVVLIYATSQLPS